MSVINYAPVAHFSAETVGDSIKGIAAPADGPRPCLIGLFAGDIPVSFARAARFSEAAEKNEIRLGWCGFQLPALDQAVALGGKIEVRCGVSGRSVMKPNVDVSVFGTAGRLNRVLSVVDAMRLVREAEACPDRLRLEVFAREHFRQHGPRSFLSAAYQTVLGREIDAGALAQWDHVSDHGALMTPFLERLAQSQEFVSMPYQVLPGPFQARFAFDHGLFG